MGRPNETLIKRDKVGIVPSVKACHTVQSIYSKIRLDSEYKSERHAPAAQFAEPEAPKVVKVPTGY